MPRGKLELITGAMRGGKTKRMLFEIKRAQEHGAGRALLVKPDTDVRCASDLIQTFDGELAGAVSIPAENPEEIWKLLPKERFDIVGLDEVQFFDTSLFRVVDDLLRVGYDVYASGLETDFRGEPFGPTLSLVALLKHKDYWHRVLPYCNVCSSKGLRKVAFMTQKLVNGKPAPYSGKTVEVGDIGLYEPRCYECYEPPPDRP